MKYKLGEICDIYDGPHATPPETQTGPVFLGIKNINDQCELDFSDIKHLSPEDYVRWTARVTPQQDDIVFSYEATLNRYALIPQGFYGCLGRRLAIARVKDTALVNPHYLYHYFCSPTWNAFILANKVVGSTVLRVSVEDFPDYEVELPEIQEQNKVAKILDEIAEKKRNNNTICSELEGMAKLLYDYWFVQFDFPDENGKPYKSSGGKMVWNEELKREIPAGWEAVPFEKCITSINTGLNPRDNFKLNTGGSIKYLTVKNLTTNGMIDFSSCDMIDEEARAIVHRRSDINVGDILFASISPLGRCHIITEEPTDWDINESVFSIRPNYNNMTSTFLYMTFMSPTFVKKAEGSSAGSVFKGIRIAELQGLETILPPKDVLDKFDEQVQRLFTMKATEFGENHQLTSLRDFLLPMLMNGQVKVKEAV